MNTKMSQWLGHPKMFGGRSRITGCAPAATVGGDASAVERQSLRRRWRRDYLLRARKARVTAASNSSSRPTFLITTPNTPKVLADSRSSDVP